MWIYLDSGHVFRSACSFVMLTPFPCIFHTICVTRQVCGARERPLPSANDAFYKCAGVLNLLGIKTNPNASQ